MSSTGNQMWKVGRRLMRSPTFTLMTLVTLALGIGANTAIFSVIETVLLKPLPYPHPEELVGLWHVAPGLNIKDLNISPSLYFTYREENKTFQDVGMWQEDAVSVAGLAEPERVASLGVTETTLSLLGARPVLGRMFSPGDVLPRNPETVILSYGYWESRFGGEALAIGRRIMIDGSAREIIGVLPRDFHFLDLKPALFTPLSFERAKLTLGNFSYQGVARMKPGVTLKQVNADMARMLAISFLKFSPPSGFSVKMFEDARIAPDVRPFQRDLIGDIGEVLWVLMGTIGIVLLIACANVANLLLVRTEGRQQELAIRAALGASPARIARELLSESVALALLGGAFGVGVAYAALRVLAALHPEHLPRLDELSIDARVLIFTLVVSLLCGALFGLIPIFKYAGPKLAGALRSGGRTLSQSRERHRARSALVVVQVSLALVLLISSGLMVRTFVTLRNILPGFTHPEQIQTFRVSIPEGQVKESERVIRMHQAMLERVQVIPGVQSAAMVSYLPMDGMGWTDPIFAEDHAYRENELPALRRYKFISPGYFKTMGNSLIAGRDITWADIYDMANVALVSENMARELWHDPSSALGKRIRENRAGAWREIVGVLGNERNDGITKPAPTIVYFPVLMKNFEGNDVNVIRSLSFVVRAQGAGSEALLKQLRQAVWSVNGALPLADARTLESVYRSSFARTSLTLVLLAIAGAMALLLGVIGIYGVVSYSVSQRTREIGIRLAIGAQREELTRMFVRHALILAAIGIAFGLVAAAGLTRLMTSLLVDVSPLDPATYIAVPVILAGAAVLASYVPARRVSAVDPVEALRAE
jgi:putative ABC transport system permease protein